MSTTIHAVVNPPSSNCPTTTTVAATATATIVPSTSTVPGNGENTSFKNRLQEFAQRASISIPSYETVNVSEPLHLPQFRSSVEVDGETYTSLNTYPNKKAAEQDAAKVALEGIYKKIKDSVSKKTTIRGFPPIFQDKVFCKSILHEFAAKMNMEMPKYDTVKLEGLLPIFVTTVIFNGVKYAGTLGVNKKEAEQLAARTAILSILVDSGLGMHLSEVIKSKAKLFSIVHEDIHANVETTLETSQIKGDGQGTSQTDYLPGNVMALDQSSSSKGVFGDQPGNVETTLDTSTIKGDGQGNSQTDYGTENFVALDQSLSGKGVFGDQPRNVIGNVEEQSSAIPSHEFRKPEVGSFIPGVLLPIENVPSRVVAEPEPWTFSQAVPLPILFPSFAKQNLANASACGKKRKQRRKKKANKKVKEDTAKQVSELPLNQSLV